MASGGPQEAVPAGTDGMLDSRYVVTYPARKAFERKPADYTFAWNRRTEAP